MKKGHPRRLDFEIDKLTNSIENTLTGEKLDTEIITLRADDLPAVRKLKWQFNWSIEFQKAGRETFALVTKGNPSVWHGLVSSSEEHDHLFMHLIESAPFNIGHDKLFAGVMGNLVAFLCKVAYERGYSGHVVFDSKTRLVEHYESALGAKRITGTRMFIGTQEADRLVKKYFPEFDHERN